MGGRRSRTDARRVAVLGYHKIGDPPPEWWSWYYVPERVFAHHLRMLSDSGWELLTGARLISGLDNPTTLPSRSALLTFDDGYATFADDALRILQEFGAPSVLFVPTDHVGASSDKWDLNVEPREALCTWEDLKSLQQADVSIESHGAAHRAYSSMTPHEQGDDATRSKRVIEQRLGTPARLLSYPYGDDGSLSADGPSSVQRAGYEAAFLYGGSVFRPRGADRYRLPRIAMGPETDLAAELAE